MYTCYDVEANTNWHVFLPSAAINTSEKGTVLVDVSQLEGHPNKIMI
jgi:hypothetical protein